MSILDDLTVREDLNFIQLEGDPEEFFSPLPDLKDLKLNARPFYLVLPSGLQYLEIIKHELARRGISVQSELNIENFETFARYTYPVTSYKPHSYLWLMLNRKLFGEAANRGYALILSDDALNSYELVAQTKREIRKDIGIHDYYVENRGNVDKVSLHHLHAADVNELSYQYNCLMNFSSLEES